MPRPILDACRIYGRLAPQVTATAQSHHHIRVTSLRLLATTASLLLALPAATARAQYPLVPTPVIDPATVAQGVRAGGFLIVRHTQEGDAGASVIRNARIGLIARPLPFVVVKVQGDLANAGRVSSDSSVSAFELTDAFVQFAPSDTVRWSRLRPSAIVGQFKQPFSLEYLTADQRLLTPDRALAVDVIAPRRDVGAMGQLDIAGRVLLMASATNGEGANARANPDGRQLYVARAVVVPVAGLALAGKIGAVRDDHLWGYDARWFVGPLSVEGEYVRRRDRASGAALVDDRGGYVMAHYRLASWLQPLAKWERLDQGASSPWRATSVTAGAIVASAGESVRAHLVVQRRHDEPIDRRTTSLVAQLVLVY